MMAKIDVLKLLGDVLACGNADKLRCFMVDDCIYKSDYAEVTIEFADAIVDRLNLVDSYISEEERYSYEMKKLADLLKVAKSDLDKECSCSFLDNCLILR